LHLFESAVLVGAGAVLIAVVDGSLRGIEATTFGAVLVLLGLVYALAAILVAQMRNGFTTAEDDEPVVFPRR
jgi:hypothetical protein